MANAPDSTPLPSRTGAVRDQLWIAAVVVLGAVLSLGAFQLVRQWDEERAELHLSLQAQAAASAVGATAERCDEVLHNLAELLGRRGDLSRGEFAEVTQPLLRRHPSLRALEWVPGVPQAERARVEAQARNELGRPFEFTQTNAAGVLVRATERPLHNPILYVEPLAGNEAALGYDLAVGPSPMQLGRACDLADLVLSRPIRLVQEPGRQLGYVAIMPVYRGGGIPRTVTERQARLTGFVQGVFRAGDFLRAAMQDAPPAMLDLMVLDLTPEIPQRVVHFLPAKEPGATPAPTEAEMRAGWHSELRMRFGERQFALLFRPAPGAMVALRTLHPFGALVSGLLLTLGGAFYALTVLRRTARVESEVATRTDELSKTSVRLSSEAAARRQAEREATRQLQLLRTLIDAIPDSIYIKDKEGRFLLNNAANRRVLGLAPGDDGAGRTVHDFPATKANADAYTADDRAVLTSCQAVINREESFTLPGGGTGWFLTTKVPVRDEAGVVTGIVGVSRDVTARQRERQALAESEARFRVLFESSPDAVFVESSEGIVLDANPAACRLHAMTRGELLGRHVTELVPPERRAAVSNNFASLFSNEISIRESESLALDGRVIPIELAARRFEFAGKVAALIHVRDISERRRTQMALERRDRILHAVARAAQTLLHAESWQAATAEVLTELGEATATDAVCLFANETLDGKPAFRSFCTWPLSADSAPAGALGYDAAGCARWRELLSRGETVHGRVRELPASERHIPERKGMKSVALTPIFAGEVWWGFLALGQADQERDWFSVELGALKTAAEVFGAAIQRAVAEAERVRIEGRLQETQKLESLGVLAGGIAHDFNNLLTSILGNASLARLDLPPRSPVEHSLEQIEQTSLRAAELCKQMLAYAGKGRFVVQPLDLTRLVQDTAHLLQVSISKKAVLKFDLAAGLPPVLADASQLRQIVMNLVINASEAIGDRSGIIALHTGLVRADRRYLADTQLAHSLPEGDYVFLEVSDTGCGMTPELKARIFEPFFTTKFTGRGLGLAAVLGIVRGHRGALRVYSEPGKGTTFKLLLPMAPGAAVELPVPSPLADGWRGSGRILLADDEETVRTVVARVLETLGFTITVAADGREAVKIFEADPDAFTLVVMDLTMPHLDGAEAFARMRLLRPDVRVVLMSGFSEHDATITFAGKGLAGFLQKPFELAHLRDKIRSVFDGTAK
jgi:PAS domain S-box-containing protein